MLNKNDKNLEEKSQKVVKFSFVTDEVVVANIPNRVGVVPLQAKDFS